MGEIIQNAYLVAVIGAGPAGLYAAQFLARRGIQVVIFNRDIKPGGLVEYGIYPSKYKLRTGLLAQFRQILEMPQVHYRGNIVIGEDGDIRLDQLREAGFNAFMVTTGAQVNTQLGLPGENLKGVYHANDIVFHYNRLPKHARKVLTFGSEVAVIGVGNVMLDIVRYFKQLDQIFTITAYARRGPTQVKFDNKSLEPVAECMNCEFIRKAVDMTKPQVKNVDQEVSGFYSILEKARQRAGDCHSKIDFRMRFLLSPKQLIPDEKGRVKELVLEHNRLVLKNSRIISEGTGKIESVPVDTVVFSIGSRVDDGFGLPVAKGNYMTTPNPRFPIDGISYEVQDEDMSVTCEDVFVSGWARAAGKGVVGLARKDAERGARAIIEYLETLNSASPIVIGQVFLKLPEINKLVVDIDGLKKLWKAEEKIAAERGLPEYKFDTHEAMLMAIQGKKPIS